MIKINAPKLSTSNTTKLLTLATQNELKLATLLKVSPKRVDNKPKNDNEFDREAQP